MVTDDRTTRRHDANRSARMIEKSHVAFFTDHPQLRPNVISRCIQHGRNRITSFPFKISTIDVVTGFRAANDRFNGLWPLGFTSILDAHAGVIGIHAAIAQINIKVMDCAIAENLCLL